MGKTRFYQSQSHQIPRENTTSEGTISRVLSHPIVVIVWVLFCVGVSVSLWNTTARSRHAFVRQQEAQEKVSQEEERGLQLLQKLEDSEQSFTKERIYRDELGLQKPGETILHITEQAPSPEE